MSREAFARQVSIRGEGRVASASREPFARQGSISLHSVTESSGLLDRAKQDGSENLIMGVDSVYEWRDTRGQWWPVTLVGVEASGNLSASVHDGRGSRWQTVNPAAVRLVPENSGPSDSRTPASAAVLPRHALRTVSMCSILDSLGDAIFAPALPILAFSLGATTPQVVLLYAVWSLAQLISSPVLTFLAEQYGPRYFLLLSLLFQLVGTVLQTVAPNLTTLACGRALSGAFAMTGQFSQSYLTEGGDPAFLREWRTIRAGASGGGQVLGPPLGGCLAMVDRRLPGLASVLIGLLNLVSVAINTRPRSSPLPAPAEEEDPEDLRDPPPPPGLDLSATCLYGGGTNYACRVLGASIDEEHIWVHFYTRGDGSFGALERESWRRSELWAVLTTATATGGGGTPHAQIPLRILPEQCNVSESPGVIQGTLCFATTNLQRVAEYHFRFGSPTAGYSRCVLPYPLHERTCGRDTFCCSKGAAEAMPVSAWGYLWRYTRKDTWFIFLAALFSGICYSLPLSVLPAFAISQWQFRATDVGLLLAVGSAAAVIPSLYFVSTEQGAAVSFGESVVRKLGVRCTAAVCLIVSGTALLLIPTFPFPSMMTAMLAVSRAARAVGDRATRLILKETFGSRLRSSLLVRMRQTCLHIGFTIGPVLACTLLGIFTTLPFLLAGLAGLLAAYFIGTQEQHATDNSDRILNHELETLRPVSPQVEEQWAALGVKIAMLLRRKRYPIAVSQPHILQAINGTFPVVSATSRRDYVRSLREQGILGRLTEQSYEQAYARYGALERQHL
eukprot:Hpha_TRINITY_DN19268_c0_g1::TRINITY_DN19268_c0_g1_i1::g.194408::m.194408